MKLRTEIKIPKGNHAIGYNDHILSIGSCFSSYMSDYLKALKYPVFSNPCGITFNPASILTTLKRVSEPDSLHESQLILNNGLYSHPDFHSSFNNPSAADYLTYARNQMTVASEILGKAAYVIITIGTCHVFKSVESGAVVNNCHKLPPETFTKALMSVNEVSHCLHSIRQLIQEASTKRPQIIFTLSPVRHIKNGLVADRRSKSIAHTAIHDIVDVYDDCHYFPSYEIMVDDLRDYRFYKADKIHPTELAIEHIWELFSENWLDIKEQSLRNRIYSINARQSHRALFPDSPDHIKFKETLKSDISSLIREYPFLEGKI